MAQVDIVVPCYNYARFLRECVASVLGQQGVDVRVLIIDDASSDDTAEVAAELAARDDRVEFRRHSVNRGHIETYNEGLLGWATAEYLLLLSADDVLTSGALLRAARLMEARPDVGLTYGRAIETDRPEPGAFASGPECAWRVVPGLEFSEAVRLMEARPDVGLTYGRAIETDRPEPGAFASGPECAWRVVPGPKFFEFGCREGHNLISPPTAVVRTRLQHQVGGYRKDLPHTGDMEMWLRLALHTNVGVLDADQAFYRVHGANMHDTYHGLRDARQAKLAFEVLFAEYGCRMIDRARLHRLAFGNLAEWAFWQASHLFDQRDMVSYREHLEFALDLDPTLPRRPAWWRFRCKRLFGPRLWSALRPFVNQVRGRALPVPAGD